MGIVQAETRSVDKAQVAFQANNINKQNGLVGASESCIFHFKFARLYDFSKDVCIYIYIHTYTYMLD